MAWKVHGIAGAILILLLVTSAGTVAREYRATRRISTPASTVQAGEAVAVIRPIPRDVVLAAVEEIYDKYNTPEFRQALSKDFYDASRLEDAIFEKVPRDARLRVLSIQGMQTFDQRIRKSSGGGPDILTSTVSVTVRAQMEFTEGGLFQRREGTNEHVLRIHQKITPELSQQIQQQTTK